MSLIYRNSLSIHIKTIQKTHNTSHFSFTKFTTFIMSILNYIFTIKYYWTIDYLEFHSHYIENAGINRSIIITTSAKLFNNLCNKIIYIKSLSVDPLYAKTFNSSWETFVTFNNCFVNTYLVITTLIYHIYQDIVKRLGSFN